MDEIDELLVRGVENIIPSKEKLEELLRSGKKINVYNGVDPTAVHLHLGHVVPLRKLQQLVKLGHHISFLIGDFTAFIGDTSDKTGERPQLTEDQIVQNWQTYKKQAQKFLDFTKVKVVRNSTWLDKVTFRDVIKMSRHFSLNDFISRELIKKRLNDGGSVNLAEAFYPLAQGYDSWHLKTDLQIGGTEQIFNIQAGRTLIKDLDGRESFALTNSTLEGTDGRKMSKSWGNAIWVEDQPSEMYGKIMSLKDELINQYFVLATNLPLAEIPKEGHPIELKKKLAHQIVRELHSKEAADKAQGEFEKTFQKGKVASDLIQEFKAGPGKITDRLVEAGIVESKSEAKRLEDQGAIEEVKPGVFRIGKKKFIKFV